jgi:RNA polymerase sigma-70 factor (ECF subfamily)
VVPDGDDDVSLLRAWQNGDRLAAGTLMSKYFSMVYRFFATKMSDAAEDLSQRTFLAALESGDRFDASKGTFRSYLLGIARNQLRGFIEERARHQRRPDFLESSIAALGGSPSRVVAGAEQKQILLAALRSLPVDFQITVELHYWEGMKLAEIAGVLGVAPGTVKSRLHRAKQMLNEVISSMDIDPSLRESTMTRLDDWARALRASIDAAGDE